MVGQPVPILIGGNFYTENLRGIFNREDVCNLPACIVAVAGPMRTGKSLLLCYLLRYLQHGGCDGWMGGENEPLRGFQHAQSEDGLTKGINIWSEPFIVNTSTGKVAVFLVDSQGAWDSSAMVGEENLIFALTQQLSSVMVYNLMGRINESDLNNLQVFSSYAKAQDLYFQKLSFLVRDWNSPLMYRYGSSGGERLCNDKLKVNDSQSKRSQEIRQYLWNSYNEITCFLMPDPGTNVREKEGFDGRQADLNDCFKMHLKEFTEQLLSSCHLVIKNMNGQNVTGRELYNHIREYSEDSHKNMSSFDTGNLLEMNAEHRSTNNEMFAHEEFINKMKLIKEDVLKVIKSKDIMSLFSVVKEDITSTISEIKDILSDWLNSKQVPELISAIAKEMDIGLLKLMKQTVKDKINVTVNQISLGIQRILNEMIEVKAVVKQVVRRVVELLLSIMERMFDGFRELFRPQFGIWMGLQERIVHAVNETYIIFENGNRYAAINAPETAEKSRKRFEILLSNSQTEYISDFERMGLTFWRSSIVFGCCFGGLLGAPFILACTSTGGAVLGAVAGTAITTALSTTGLGAAASTVASVGAEATTMAMVEIGASMGIGINAAIVGGAIGGAAIGGIVGASGLVYYLMKKHRKSIKKPPMCRETNTNEGVNILTALGYDKIIVIAALSASENDIEMALKFLHWELGRFT